MTDPVLGLPAPSLFETGRLANHCSSVNGSFASEQDRYDIRFSADQSGALEVAAKCRTLHGGGNSSSVSDNGGSMG